MYNRLYLQEILTRLNEERRFIQVISGPRQVGKTTLIQQATEDIGLPVDYLPCDEPAVRDRVWIEQNWEKSRITAKEKGEVVIVFDEIQKIEGWSETVKRLWDEDSINKIPLKVFLLGSSPLLIQRGVTESLAGRFEIIRIPHWSYSEMRDAFGLDLEQYIYFGGYPGSAQLINDETRWKRYINDALIETTISKDILLMRRIDKPALFRRMFYLGCSYSGQILSYQKMVGQLQDAGNTTTLAHYLELLGQAGLVCGLDKFAIQRTRRRASSPKFQVLNNALMTAALEISFKESTKDRDLWGRLVESAVGAHLINSLTGTMGNIFYWRERASEVDFVVSTGKKIVAIEVKSGRRKERLSGMEEFSKRFRPGRILLVGGDGIALEEFLSKPAAVWLE